MKESNITESIKEEFKERLRHPIMGSIITSLFLWNWKIPETLIFGPDQGRPYVGRFALIESLISDIHVHWVYQIIVPIVFAFLYLIVSHLAGYFYFKHWESKWKFQREKKKQEDLNDLKEIEKYRVFLRQILDLSKTKINIIQDHSRSGLDLFQQYNSIGSLNQREQKLNEIKGRFDEINKSTLEWLNNYNSVFGGRSSDDQSWLQFKIFKDSLGKKFTKLFGKSF